MNNWLKNNKKLIKNYNVYNLTSFYYFFRYIIFYNKMNTISDKTFDILVFSHDLYIKRINDELEYLKQQTETDDIKSRIEFLESIVKKYQEKEEEKTGNNIDKILEEKTTLNADKAFKKTWGRMNIAFKKIKLEEFCKEHKINTDTKIKYFQLLEEKQLKTKNVKYDCTLMKIIEIKI